MKVAGPPLHAGRPWFHKLLEHQPATRGNGTESALLTPKVRASASISPCDKDERSIPVESCVRCPTLFLAWFEWCILFICFSLSCSNSARLPIHSCVSDLVHVFDLFRTSNSACLKKKYVVQLCLLRNAVRVSEPICRPSESRALLITVPSVGSRSRVSATTCDERRIAMEPFHRHLGVSTTALRHNFCQ